MNLNKKTKKTLSAAAFLALCLAAVLLFNVVIGAAADKIQLRWDLTEEKLYALKDETKAVLKNLKDDVTLYYFVSDGHENEQIVNVLNMYRTASNRLKIVKSDPNTDPIAVRRFTDKGAAIEQNTIILERGTRYRVISPSEIYQNYGKQSGETVQNAFFGLEQLITRAIAFVAANKTNSVFFTVGHNEADYTPVINTLGEENIEYYQIDLKTGDIPDAADAIYIMAPTDDFTDDEIFRLDAFLSKGKGAHISFDAAKKPLPKLEAYLKDFWGVTMYHDLVCESDANRTLNYSYMFMPDVGEHPITNDISAKNNRIVLMHTRSMEISSVQEVTASPLLVTSSAAFSLHGSDPTVKENIREGALPVAAVLTRQVMDKPEARLVVSGSYKMYETLFLEEASVANRAFLLGATNYVVKNEDTMSVSPKSLLTYALMLSDGMTNFYIITVCALPALLFFALGIFTWRKRRHL